MRVLTPREMIELYVGEENVDADHIDFKKALDLLGFVNLEDEEKETIWLHIWVRSILKNTWTDIDKDNPLESVRDTVFFRLVEFAFMQGKNSLGETLDWFTKSQKWFPKFTTPVILCHKDIAQGTLSLYLGL